MRRREAYWGAFGFLLATTIWSLLRFRWGASFGRASFGDGIFLLWAACPPLLVWMAFGSSLVLGLLGAAMNGAAFAGASAVLKRPAVRGSRRALIAGLVFLYWFLGVTWIPLLMFITMQGSND